LEDEIVNITKMATKNENKLPSVFFTDAKDSFFDSKKALSVLKESSVDRSKRQKENIEKVLSGEQIKRHHSTASEKKGNACRPAIQCCLIWAIVAIAGGYGVFLISKDFWFHFPIVLLWGLWVVIGEIVFLAELEKKYKKVAVWLFIIQVVALLLWGIFF
jgi:hypothetical protein